MFNGWATGKYDLHNFVTDGGRGRRDSGREPSVDHDRSKSTEAEKGCRVPVSVWRQTDSKSGGNRQSTEP